MQRETELGRCNLRALNPFRHVAENICYDGEEGGLRRKARWVCSLGYAESGSARFFPEEMGSDLHRLPKMVSAAYPTSSRLSSSSPPHRLQSSDRCVDDRALVLLHAQLRGLSGIKVIFSCPR
jgi:hypothetical protein